MTLKSLLIPLLLLAGPLTLASQNLDALRNEIRQAEEEIRMTNELLNKTQKNQKSTTQQLNLIRNKIQNRKTILSNLEQQTGMLSQNITTKSGTIQSLEQEVARHRSEYAAMVRDAYKNYLLNNFVLFLFDARNFNDVTRRIAYMRRYNRLRERKVAAIDSLSQNLHQEVTSLQSQKEELDKVRRTRGEELNALSKDEGQYRNTADQLKKEAGKLSSTIQSRKNRIAQLQQQIRRIIAEESKKSNTRPKNTQQREYDTKLTGAFDQNRGKLPYPVRGVIIDRYGIHPHASIKGLTVNNTGVDIAAEQGAEVRAVFEGEVSQIFAVPGMNNGVILRHGTYFTVYGNLVSITIKAGDKVSLGQPIGRLGATEGDDESTLHFEVWKEGSPNPSNLNPEQWLRR
ncbi:MAG: peptidoglycan DD-metalloendopeptidase family protein [Alistipes sp.]|nr:peptidoglycan DD-metalloendopeptidase family protein [Alistipes sp.]